MSKSQSDHYTPRAVGTPDSLEYRLYLESGGSPISIWHDVPLYSDDDKQVLNMVVEIPRWSNAKFEISRNEAFNPIKQDIKDDRARFVRNLFPYKGYIWNYGALPGTWEDPSHVHPDTEHPGDNDPLDALEIGERVAYTGQIKRVKVLGVMALLDEGATDWKIIVIDINDPCASKVNGIADVQQQFPGLLEATRDWFKFYKVPDGKKPNKIALNEEFKDQQ
ncbi:Inorganic pyrophosphatase [Exophiala sideris]|uniref:inorganic diphosphatase n=1 Tax=Exophiala sideris TaxID=1016849 RepID=A0ABR0IVI7_9EURO|nr:Inorganic pyrophosphatase [Exophiala sideris]